MILTSKFQNGQTSLNKEIVINFQLLLSLISAYRLNFYAELRKRIKLIRTVSGFLRDDTDEKIFDLADLSVAPINTICFHRIVSTPQLINGTHLVPLLAVNVRTAKPKVMRNAKFAYSGPAILFA